jgi:hypothetical protein
MLNYIELSQLYLDTWMCTQWWRHTNQIWPVHRLDLAAFAFPLLRPSRFTGADRTTSGAHIASHVREAMCEAMLELNCRPVDGHVRECSDKYMSPLTSVYKIPERSLHHVSLL